MDKMSNFLFEREGRGGREIDCLHLHTRNEENNGITSLNLSFASLPQKKNVLNI